MAGLEGIVAQLREEKQRLESTAIPEAQARLEQLREDARRIDLMLAALEAVPAEQAPAPETTAPEPQPVEPPQPDALKGLTVQERAKLVQAEMDRKMRDLFVANPGQQFTRKQLVQTLDVTVHSTPLNRSLTRLADKGIITRTPRGPRAGGPLYQYAPPTGPGPGNPPAPPTDAIPGPVRNGRGAPVAGTGKGVGVKEKEFAKLLAPALADGWELQHGSGHKKLVKGKRSITLSNTPSDTNAVHSLRRQLIRERVPV